MVIYGQNEEMKQVQSNRSRPVSSNSKIGVISRYSDIEGLSSDLLQIHFRKFLNCRILYRSLERCNKLKIISVSKSAYSRCDEKTLNLIKQRGIEIKVSRGKGRPSLLEMILW